MTNSATPLPELIEGPDLVLRRWRTSELALLSTAVARNVEHLRPWMPWVGDEPLGATARRELVERWERSWEQGGDVVLGAFLGDQVVGSCGLHRRRGPHGLEIGYWVDADSTGRGIGTEIGRLLTTAALTVPEVSFAEIHHDKANIASGRIPERLGYTFIGEAPDEVTAPGEVGIDCTWRVHVTDWRDGR